MSLYEQWVSLAYNQNGKSINKIWDIYSPLEKKIYEYLLDNKQNWIKGNISELSAKFNMKTTYFVGFLDGIRGALNEDVDVNTIDDNYEVNISFDWEALYKKMVEYKASDLYGLANWENIFTKDEQERLYKEQKESRTVVVGEKFGRNDPCPCGSGKKYKKCCGV